MNSRKNDIPGYLYALDGMRALSLIFIVMFHTFQQSWIFYNLKIGPNKYLFNFEIFQRYGYVAIDSFFVLSGFCLFYPIARDMFSESKFQGWKNFFIKRARRIYPAYIIALLFTVIVPTFSYVGGMYDPKNFLSTARNIIMHLLFIHNFDSATLGTTIGTAWTMSVEVQFYLLFPLICIPFRKKPVLTAIGMIFTAVILRLLLMMNINISPAQISAITPIYFDVFAFGMISAYFVVYIRNKVNYIGKLKLCMTIISALCIFTVYGYIKWLGKASFPQGIGSDVYFRFLYRGIFSALIALFLLTACFSYGFWEKKIWGNKFFVFLSSISYTVYLWHQNIYIFLKNHNIPYTTQNPVMNDRNAMDGLTLICLSASVIIGVLVTNYIETPIVKYGFKGSLIRLSEKLHITEHNKSAETSLAKNKKVKKQNAK